MSKLLELKNLTVNFDNKPIVKNFSFSLEKGEVAVLKGPSGLGKSTLLNVIMGFVKPGNGDVHVDGIKLNKDSIDEIRRKISWLPQNPSIIGSGNVLEVIYKPFKFNSNKNLKPDIDKIHEDLGYLGLDISILNNNYEDLSGGERQRIGIIISKLLKREIMLLDEPVASLDKDSIQRAADYLLDGNVTILSTSHDEYWSKRCDSEYDFLKIKEQGNAGV